MLALLAVVFWSVVLSYALYRIIHTWSVSMTWIEVMLAFGFKVVSGCAYGYVFLHYYGGDDTWLIHADSIREGALLLNDPLQFFWEYTPGSAINKATGFLKIAGYYVVDLEYCLQAKTLAIVNLISNGNYYINVVFWNFIIFWGHYWLFSFLVKRFPSKRRIYFLLVFLFPPVIFWLSGIRSDGLLFFFLSLLLLHFDRWLHTRRLSSLLLCIAGFAGVIIVRLPVAALVIPALISWWLSVHFHTKTLLSYLVVYTLSGIVFFGSTIAGSAGFPGIVVQRQAEFLKLQGTAFKLEPLEPSLKSFAGILPQAAENTFLRPYLWETKGLLQAIAASDIIFFWLLFLAIFFKHDPKWKKVLTQPFLMALLFFSVSLYLFVGYTIPFPGAIVRYKIIPELFLMVTMGSCLRLENKL